MTVDANEEYFHKSIIYSLHVLYVYEFFLLILIFSMLPLIFIVRLNLNPFLLCFGVFVGSHEENIFGIIVVDYKEEGMVAFKLLRCCWPCNAE